MNKKYILNKIKPYLNHENMIGEKDFNNLFCKLPKTQQYEIVDILIEENIDIDYENITLKKVNNIKSTITLQDIFKVTKLTNEELCLMYQKGNKEALEALIIKNSKLVWSRVLKYEKRYKHKLELEDLYEYGLIGIIKAAQRFKIEKEAKFTTYSIWWIDQNILRSIVDFGYTIRIPVHYFEQINRLMRILSKNLDCSKDQIFEMVKDEGINKEKFEEILMIIKNIITITSLNALVGEDEENELGDFILYDESTTVEEVVEYNILKETIDKVLNTLKKREKDILEQRFGLKDGIDKTLEEIGSKYGVTRERVRQIEAKSLRKLRHPSRSKKLVDFIRSDS